MNPSVSTYFVADDTISSANTPYSADSVPSMSRGICSEAGDERNLAAGRQQ